MHERERGPAPGDGQPVVLVVDDEPAVRDLFLVALQRDGYRGLAAASGAAALEMLAREHVDVVLLDRSMSGMSGEQLLRRLRSEPSTQRVSVVMVSGDADLDSKLDGLGAGANDYLVKPVALPELLARVAAQLEDRSRWHEHLTAKLATRTRLSREILELSSELSLERFEVELQRILEAELDLRHLEVVPRGASTGTAGHDTPWSVWARPGVDGRSNVRFRIPLRGRGGILASLSGVAGGAQEDAVPTLLDLAPQIASLVEPTLRRQDAEVAAQQWVFDMLAEQQFRCAYQPIVALDDRATVGSEGLSRFADGTAPEGVFRSAARRGVTEQLELGALVRLMAQARTLPDHQWLSLNLSAATSLSAEVLELVAAADRRIILEITEHESIVDYAALRERFDRCEGVSLAVDDAGAGYASLRHIFELEPELIKLDRSWVGGIDTDPVRRALIQGLMGFADAVGSTVLGEGVEREEEAQALADIGVPLAQGYLFGRAAAAAAAPSSASRQAC